MQAGFCHEVATHTGDSAFASAAYDEHAGAWSLPTSVTTDDPAALTAHAGALPAAEHRAVEALDLAARG